jgi:Tfp pilus assembly protein PilO
MDKEKKEELEKAIADLEKKVPQDKATQKMIEDIKKKLEE